MRKKSINILIFLILIIAVVFIFYSIAKLSDKVDPTSVPQDNPGQELINEANEINEDGDIVNEENINEENINEDIVNREENIIIENGPVDPVVAASEEAMAREMPFPGIDGFGLEFMNDEEKDEFRIPSNKEDALDTKTVAVHLRRYKDNKHLFDWATRFDNCGQYGWSFGGLHSHNLNYKKTNKKEYIEETSFVLKIPDFLFGTNYREDLAPLFPHEGLAHPQQPIIRTE